MGFQIYKFLARPSEKIDEVRRRIISKKKIPLIDRVFSKIEEKRDTQGHAWKTCTRGPIENSTLATANADANANKIIANQRMADDNFFVWCDYCDKPQQTRETCWKLYGKPPTWKSSKPGDKTNQVVHAANEIEKSIFSNEHMRF